MAEIPQPKFTVVCLRDLEEYTDENIEELKKKCEQCEQKCVNYKVVQSL